MSKSKSCGGGQTILYRNELSFLKGLVPCWIWTWVGFFDPWIHEKIIKLVLQFEGFPREAFFYE